MLLVAIALAEPILVEGGSYEPMYPANPDDPVVTVAPFQLDATPVTRHDFQAFVRADPSWQRGAVPRIMADEGYLASWTSPTQAGGDANAPVTEVSWFAARAFCEARGARLPTEAEWELVARASPTARDATGDPGWAARILGWYARSSNSPGPVGQGDANAWGVHDLHGLVWEWVEDYNNTLFGSDARDSGDEDTLRFCGAGALSATSPDNYATFMRYAFRSSLKGAYTTRTLGFRCAMDAP